MIDYTKFINSKDIAEHLKKIEYVPSSAVEAAFIVWQRYKKWALDKEKYEAWNEIIATMPDAAVAPRYNTEGVDSIHTFLKENMENRAAMEDLFEALWFKIPTPFKKGDILVERPRGKSSKSGVFSGVPFVLTDMSTWGKAELIANGYTDADFNLDRADKNLNLHINQCDFSDMTAHGYFVHNNGDIVFECVHNYLSCEYYRGPLDGHMRIAKALSSYLKHEISIGLLLNASRYIYAEEQLKPAQYNLWQYDDEGLLLAGIERKRENK